MHAVLVERHRTVDRAVRHPAVQRQAFQAPRGAVVAQHDRLGRQQRAQSLDDERQQPLHPGGIGLNHQHRPEPVNDEPREAVRLGVHQAVIGR